MFSGVSIRPQQLVAEENAAQHQQETERTAGNQRCVDASFEVMMAFCAEELCGQNRTADVAAESKGDEDQRDFIAVADGGQRIVVDEFPRDKTVGDVVELLKDECSRKAAYRISIKRCSASRRLNPCSYRSDPFLLRMALRVRLSGSGVRETQRVVQMYQNAEHTERAEPFGAVFRCYAGFRGSVTRMVVPLPGALSSAIRP